MLRRRIISWRKPVRLHVSKRGAIADLLLIEQPPHEKPLEASAVEIQMQAAGLNFKDVLNVLGELPSRFLTPIGDDCAGIVAAVGESVTSLRRGDQVFGTAEGCLQSFTRARTNALLVTPRPSVVPARAACTLPAVWITSHEVLSRAEGRKGEDALLHATAGGVGLIGLEYLRWLDVGVYGSAGGPAKHRLLRQLLPTINSSRVAEAFAFGLATRLAGRRLQIVCNSLTADFIPASMSILGDAGRFEEIGKRGAWSQPRAVAGASSVVTSTIDLVTDVRSSARWYLISSTFLLSVCVHVAHGLMRDEFEYTIARGLPSAQIWREYRQGRHLQSILFTCCSASASSVQSASGAVGHAEREPCSAVDVVEMVRRTTARYWMLTRRSRRRDRLAWGRRAS